jgi:KDO2-lipid IV(A) lauroyltransferase
MSWAVGLQRGGRRLAFLGLRTLVRATGFAHARTVGGWLGELQFRLAGGQRRRLLTDMAHALGRRPDDPLLPALLRQAYRVNDGAVLEIMAMFDRRQDEADLAARCELEGLDHLRAALAEGRGVVLLASHMGNAALAATRLAQAGWPVSVVYKESRMMSAGFLQRGLEHYGIQGILANAGIRAYGQMLTALKQGRIVFMMLDQGTKKAQDGMVLRFLGKDAPMPAGPAQLARTARAPVLPLATTAASPMWRFTIEPPQRLGQASLQADVECLVGLVERHVLQRPQLWSWHQRRWRKLPRALQGP